MNIVHCRLNQIVFHNIDFGRCLFKGQKFTGPTILAGFPATRVYAGTSLVTTAPAATMHHFPKVAPHKIVALAPIEAPYLTTVSLTSQSSDDYNVPSGFMERGYLSFVKDTDGPTKTPSSSVTP